MIRVSEYMYVGHVLKNGIANCTNMFPKSCRKCWLTGCLGLLQASLSFDSNVLRQACFYGTSDSNGHSEKSITSELS